MNHKNNGFYCNHCRKEVGRLPGYPSAHCTECGDKVHPLIMVKDTQVVKTSEDLEARLVFGSATQMWYLVGPEDRDYFYGIEVEEFDIDGPDTSLLRYQTGMLGS